MRLEEYHANADTICYYIHFNGKSDQEYDFLKTLEVDFTAYCYLLEHMRPEFFSALKRCSCSGYPVHFSEENVMGIACSKNPEQHRVFCKTGLDDAPAVLFSAWNHGQTGGIETLEEWEK